VLEERIDPSPSTSWVKGELLTALDDARLDPKQMLAEPGTANLFDSVEWFRLQARHLDSTETPLIARAWSERGYVWLFLARSVDGKARGLSNWYSFSFAPVFRGLIDNPHKGRLLTGVARRLRKLKQPISVLTLAPVRGSQEMPELIEKSFRQAGWLARSDATSVSWTADVASQTSDEYWAARPGALRSTVERKQKKSGITTDILTRFDADIWDEYERIYAESWKPEEGDPAMLRELAERASADGRLRLGLAKLGDAIIAAQFWTVDGGTANIHKLAYLNEHREHSPGSILSAAIFRHVIDEDHVHTIDYGTGDDGYKRDWMTDSTPLYTLTLFNPSTLAGLMSAARAWISGLVRARQSD
jgi:Acetyltransferase (GNAT) domain